MKSVLITAALLPLASAGAVFKPRNNNNGCNADNCARAVTGTRRGPESMSSFRQDCTSFMSTTVTPPMSTVIVTTTADSCDEEEDVAPQTLLKRVQEKRAEAVTVFPTAVPTYASACSGAVRYSSACSCWGVTAAVTTAPTPVITVTITVY
ncbi:hypothetical protein PG997_005690 [Apiospora hydei]|uniref:Uncharacterized protein n=1 Tax=Apiospora hydei TaxID=1337664 RepID=A0ABR1WLP7_9PEZI